MTVALTKATLRASWWRRLVALLFGARARPRCHRCGKPFDRETLDAKDHELLCAWFDELAAERSRRLSGDLAAAENARASDIHRATMRRMLGYPPPGPPMQWPRAPRPVATSLPGPLERQSR